MRLSEPTDFLILDELSDGRRNVASNIALNIDKKRSYVNRELRKLDDANLIIKIGPAERSGLYEITDKGLVVLNHREAYSDSSVDFDELVESELASE